MFAFRDTQGGVDVAFTDRHGGVSTGAYASLNLAGAGDDDPEAVEENLRRVVASFASRGQTPRVVRMHQVHGADVIVVEEAPESSSPERCDGLVTRVPGVVLMVRMADCVPVLLADPVAGVIGAAHAGRRGLVAGVVPQTLRRMRALGAGAVTAWVGPHVCGRCYEVPETMRDEVAEVVPDAYAETSWGTPALDVGRGVRVQLEQEGVEVVDAGRCTLEDDDLFSYRRQGAASGRMAGLVWVRP